MSPLRRQVTIENLRGGCHGIVTHDGEQDACGKPVTVIIDGHGTEAEGFWPACTYHGNRYGGGRVVPLEVLVDVLAGGGAGRG